jgi:hypothetical protein
MIPVTVPIFSAVTSRAFGREAQQHGNRLGISESRSSRAGRVRSDDTVTIRKKARPGGLFYRRHNLLIFEGYLVPATGFEPVTP